MAGRRSAGAHMHTHAKACSCMPGNTKVRGFTCFCCTLRQPLCVCARARARDIATTFASAKEARVEVGCACACTLINYDGERERGGGGGREGGGRVVATVLARTPRRALVVVVRAFPHAGALRKARQGQSKGHCAGRQHGRRGHHTTRGRPSLPSQTETAGAVFALSSDSVSER